MPVLIDSNVLIFSIQQGHPWHEESIKALEFFLAADERVCVFLQNIAEFWNVCTRPADKNGLGLPAEETERRLTGLDPILTLLHDTPAVYPEWRKLLVQHEVKGIQVHDARSSPSSERCAVSCRHAIIGVDAEEQDDMK